MTYEQTISDVSTGVELVGIAVLIAGGLYSLITFATALANRRTRDAYEVLRRTLGRSIPDRAGDPRRRRHHPHDCGLTLIHERRGARTRSRGEDVPELLTRGRARRTVAMAAPTTRSLPNGQAMTQLLNKSDTRAALIGPTAPVAERILAR